MTQSLATAIRSAHPAAQEFLDALAVRDFDRIQRSFAADVQFRALTPSGLREALGAESAAEWLRRWFGDADQLEMLDSTIEPVGDRIRIAYRLRVREDAWSVVEQQAFCTIGGDGVEAIDLVCSGFRPE
jgi:hypothetical protein